MTQLLVLPATVVQYQNWYYQFSQMLWKVGSTSSYVVL